MVNFYPGVAGRRGYNPTHLVYHNDGGSQGATAAFYRGWLPYHEATLGFAHDYVASDGIYHAEGYENKAWHTANSTGNRDYIGIEICQSLGDEKTFLANEQKAFQLGAKVCKQFGWKVTTDLFPLHKELSSTDCPHRTWALHGKSVQAIRQYYCDQTKKYMGDASVPGNSGSTVTEIVESEGEIDMMFIYEEKQKSGKGTDVYLAFNDKRMHLATTTWVKEAEDLIKRYGGSKNRTTYGWDNFGLRMIKAATTLVKP